MLCMKRQSNIIELNIVFRHQQGEFRLGFDKCWMSGNTCSNFSQVVPTEIQAFEFLGPNQDFFRQDGDSIVGEVDLG